MDTCNSCINYEINPDNLHSGFCTVNPPSGFLIMSQQGPILQWQNPIVLGERPRCRFFEAKSRVQ